MRILPLVLDDDLATSLQTISAGQGRAETELVMEMLRQYVRAEQLRQALQDPTLIALYQELADEDVYMAEEGLADYTRQLEEADRRETRMTGRNLYGCPGSNAWFGAGRHAACAGIANRSLVQFPKDSRCRPLH